MDRVRDREDSFDFEGGERRNERVRKICEHEDRAYQETKLVEVSQVALVKGKAQ